MAIELYSFADESGIHKDPKYCIIAGYIGSPRAWTKFQNSWQGTLEKYKVPVFHAGDFFGRKPGGERVGKEYDGWSDEKGAKFIRSLTGAIDHQDIYPIGGAVDVEQFNALTEGERRLFTGGNLVNETGKWTGNTGSLQPYHLAFLLLLTEATMHVDVAKYTDVKINFVFDIQNVLQEHAIRTFNDTKQRLSHPVWAFLGDITYADKKNQIALQAADLNAYCWHQHFTTKGNESKEVGLALDVLQKKRNGMRIWDKETSDKALSEQPEKVRAILKVKKS